MIFRKKWSYVSLFIGILVATWQLDAMKPSCLCPPEDTVQHNQQDPSFATAHIEDLHNKLGNAYRYYEKRTSRYRAEECAYILWEMTRFQELYEHHDYQTVKEIIADEIKQDKHVKDTAVQYWILHTPIAMDEYSKKDYVLARYLRRKWMYDTTSVERQVQHALYRQRYLNKMTDKDKRLLRDICQEVVNCVDEKNSRKDYNDKK